MRAYGFDRFLIRGEVQCPQDVAGEYITIAPSSEVDICKVGEFMLGPGTVMPFPKDGKIKAVRAPRLLPAGLSGSQNNIEGRPPTSPERFAGPNRLDVQIWNKGEQPVAGPRAPWLGSMLIPGANIGANAANANRMLRIPFFGRSKAVVNVRRFNDLVNNTQVVLRAVKYFPRDWIPDTGTSLAGAAWYNEITLDVFNGGAAPGPVSSITGGQDVITGEANEQAVQTGLLFRCGDWSDGTSLGAAFCIGADEIEVLVFGAAGAANTWVVVNGEAMGETNGA